jgi:hypothetical protein
MFSPGRRVRLENRAPNSFEMEMAFPTASRHTYSAPGIQENLSRWHRWQTTKYEDTSVEDYRDRPACEISPGDVFVLKSTLPTWQQTQSAMCETALAAGLSDFAGLENSLTGHLNFMSHSDLIMPSANPLFITNNELNEGLGIFGPTPLFNGLDCTSSGSNLQSHFAQSQPMQREPAGFDGFNSCSMRDQGLRAPVNDQLLLDYQGWCPSPLQSP